MLIFCAAVLLLVLNGCQAGLNYSIQNRPDRLREYLQNQVSMGESPGIEYVVVNMDSTMFSYSGGLADVAGKVGVHDSTTMMIYSMTKTITAAAVLQLVAQGRISLDDPVKLYYPHIPYGKSVTIRHLLSQTSGIPNPIPLRWVHLVDEHQEYDEESELQRILAENNELDFIPGTKYEYSNISYWLLGRVIENVSGLKYAEYIQRNIAQRLELDRSEFDVIIPSPHNHSKGYLPKWSFINLFKSFVIDAKYFGEYEDGWLHVNDHYLNGSSFGGIVSSARSIGVFLQDQLRDSSRLFDRRTKALFFEKQTINDGESIDMTLGWHIGAIGDDIYYYKEGGGGGFHCEMRLYPLQKIATVVIANNTTFNVKKFLNTSDAEFLTP